MVENDLHAGDHTISFYEWNNPGSDKVLLIGPAMGVHRRFYNNLAEDFFNTGYSVLSFNYFSSLDHKVKSNSLSLFSWGFTDTNAMINYALEMYPGQKLCFIGHSVAGQVFPFAPDANKVSSAYFVATQNIYINLWKGFDKFLALILWHINIPVLTALLGFLPGWAYAGKRPLHKNIARAWRAGGLNKQGTAGSVKGGIEAYNNLNVPTRFISIEGDNILAPLNSVMKIMETYGTGENTHLHLDDKSIGHFGYFKKEGKHLWNDAKEWFRINRA